MSEVKRYDCTNGGASFCQGCYTMTECEHGDYVSAEDYDALAAENERLLKAGQTLQADYSSYRREVEHKQGYYDALAARVAELERDAARYRAFRAADLPNGLGVYGEELDAACDELAAEQEADSEGGSCD